MLRTNGPVLWHARDVCRLIGRELRRFCLNPEIYIEKGGQRLRCGYTTGTCAAAASRAAAEMLCSGKPVYAVRIRTPKGPVLTIETDHIALSDGRAVCAVKKDSGDDPDVTNGTDVYAVVCFTEEAGVRIEGGAGVGRVTRPGLDQPVGNAAINSVPRRMIRENVTEVLKKYGLAETRGMSVTISIPEGRALAEKTFNPKLGIVGGISVLGTTGIVEPMSEAAIVQTIRAEISIRREEHYPLLPAAIGNYGLHFIEETWGIPADTFVTTSNFIGDAARMTAGAGFSEILMVGHIGKLVKVAGGMPNTHSMYGDNRMEVMAEIAGALVPASLRDDIVRKIKSCVMTDAALDVLEVFGLRKAVSDEITRRAKTAIEGFSDGKLRCETVMFSNKYGLLAETAEAGKMLGRLRRTKMRKAGGL